MKQNSRVFLNLGFIGLVTAVMLLLNVTIIYSLIAHWSVGLLWFSLALFIANAFLEKPLSAWWRYSWTIYKQKEPETINEAKYIPKDVLPPPTIEYSTKSLPGFYIFLPEKRLGGIFGVFGESEKDAADKVRTYINRKMYKCDAYGLTEEDVEGWGTDKYFTRIICDKDDVFANTRPELIDEIPFPRLFVFEPDGHGEYTFGTIALTEEEAREKIDAYVEACTAGKKTDYHYARWGTDYYGCKEYHLNDVFEHSND